MKNQPDNMIDILKKNVLFYAGKRPDKLDLSWLDDAVRQMRDKRKK